jgi:hypothetical protein
MKYDAIIVSFFDESDEVFTSPRCCIRIEFESDITEVGGEEDFHRF